MGLCGGWADRLKGIYSAYSWSLISDRKFYIKINEPCELKNILEPNNIDWNTNFNELYKNNPIIKYYNIFIYFNLFIINSYFKSKINRV